MQVFVVFPSIELNTLKFEPPIPIMPFDIVADDFTFL